MTHAFDHLQSQDDVLPHGQVGDDAVALAVLRKIADAVFHGIQRLLNPDLFPVHPDLPAGDRVGTEDGPHTLAASGAQKPGKAVYLALGDMKIKRPALAARQAFRLIENFLCFGGRRFFLDYGKIGDVLADHQLDQFYLGQGFHIKLPHQFAVSKHGDLIADFVDLLQKVGDENDSDASCLQIPHQFEEHLHLIVIQRRGRLVQDQHLAVGIDSPCNRDHLLNGEGTAAKLLPGSCGNAEAVQQLTGPLFHALPVHGSGPGAPDKHVFGNRKVRAQGDFLIHRADAVTLCLLRGADADGTFGSVNADFSGVHGVDSGQHLDQRGFSCAVFSHQSVDCPFPQGEVHVVQGFHTGKGFADSTHRQYNVIFHPLSSCVVFKRIIQKTRCGPRISPLRHTASFALDWSCCS